MFDKSTYISRRAALRKAVDGGILLLPGNGESPMNYADNTYRFRQDSTFLYYFGLDYAGLAAVMDLDEGCDIMFGDELTIDDIVWMGTQPSLAEKSASVGVTRTMPSEKLRPYLEEALSKGRKVRFLPPYRGEHKLFLMSVRGLQPDPDEAFIKAVVEMRIHKSAEEIAEIDKAVDVSVEMHLAAYRLARPGVTEAQIAAAVEQTACSPGGCLSFPTIATTQAQVLHNHGFVHTLRKGDLFLLDAGAETALHYCGDLSSCIPVSDRFTPEQQLIYEIQLDSFRAAVKALAPGVPFRNAHMAAATTIAERMKDLGLMKGNPEDAACSGAYALFFPCGVGHMMGLDVHDMENLGEVHVGYLPGESKSTQFGFKSLRLSRPLEPGFTFTVEPGIYFIPELIDLWQQQGKFKEFINYDRLGAWRHFGGLRNELNYVVTESGVRMLGTLKKPMTIEEVYKAKNA